VSNPLTAIVDGLSIAGMHWQVVSGILLVMIVCQLLGYCLLRWIFGEKLRPEGYYALSLAGWLVPALLLSVAWYILARITSPQVGNVIIVMSLAVTGLAVLLRIPRPKPGKDVRVVLLLVLLAVFILLLRLAFISRALLPLYFDSAQHYRYIAEILAGLEASGAATWSLAAYYHLGFHVLAAFVTSLTGSEITDVMLVLGQVLLASMPFSLFFIIQYVTQSTRAGLLALVLGAFGWYMPAHAVDWGKYPALASLALIPFILGLGYLLRENTISLTPGKRCSLVLLFLGGVLVSVVLHSRSLVVFVIAALAWLITWRAGRYRSLLCVIILAAIAAEIIYIQTEGILGPLFDPYGVKALLVTVPVLILTLFAWRKFSSLVVAFLLTSALLISSLFVPIVGVIPGFPNTTLLDRPYVEMILYLPLTLLGGLGLAGLEERLQVLPLPGNLGRLAGIFLIVLAAGHAWFKYDLYPSDCCAIASQDDLTALHWIAENLAQDALILTSSTMLNVLPTEEYQGSAGSDAGAWVTPLTGRPSTSLPFQTDFSQQQTLDTLCQSNVNYIYVGQTGYFFDDSGMLLQPDGYRSVLALPKARVYEVTGCR
jgi:hypothetical protein